MDNPDPYLTPFTWRYGSPEMREIWSEQTTRCLWRRIWVALARVQNRYGLVSAEQLADLEAHAEEVDFDRSRAVEAEVRHDVMAEVTVFASQCPIGGGIIHLGATSMDVKDNASALQVRQALDLLLARLDALLAAFADQIERWADTVCIGYTHLQPAEPTTLGYRLALYAQDLRGTGKTCGEFAPRGAARASKARSGRRRRMRCCWKGAPPLPLLRPR